MQTALVTGATGFIGGYLIAQLIERGVHVRALVRRTSRRQRLESLGAELVDGDVAAGDGLDSAVRGADVVFHLAGRLAAWTMDDFLAINERGSRNVAAACAAQSTPPVLVLASSLAAAGPAVNHRPRVETDLDLPISMYGRSKLAAEMAVREFADRVPTTIVRPPIVFGGGDPGLWLVFRTVLLRGLHVVAWRLPNRYSLIHVEDAAAGLILAAERGRRASRSRADCADECGVYYLADRPCPTYAELGKLIAQAHGYRVRVIQLHEPTGWAVATLAETAARLAGKVSPLNRDKMLEATAGSWICSSERAASELGFAVGAPLDERLRQTSAWYRQHRWM